MAGKNYWLKLQRGFFKRHDVEIIMDMPNGKDYVIFYLKLLLESIDHNGNLRFSDTIPYNEAMLASVTHTNIDIVKSAVEMFTQLNLMEIWDDGTIFMTELQKMVGSETKYAVEKREYRESKKAIETAQANLVDMDVQKWWNDTYDIYPKKGRERNAMIAWMDLLNLKVSEEEKKELATMIYKAVKLYVREYETENKEDTTYKYMPQMEKWLKEYLPDYEKKLQEQNK